MQNRLELRQSSVKKSGVFSNVTNMMGRSFISTHLAQQSFLNGDDLRKSRIQNLPNYRKTNLGETPQFVIVFQAIQIERLSSQIQLLRVKLKQAQRQLFNAANYQVQIRELTEKCFASQSELYEYREEMQKLNKICETLYHQNETLKTKLSEMDISLKQKYESEKQKNAELQQETEKWKTRYQAAEKSKAKELQDLRNLMECQRKSMIDREIREMTIRFQNERAGLQNEIRKSRQMLSNKNNEIGDLKQKCQEYEISMMEMRQHQTHIAQLQNKISLLSQELVRLNQVLRDRQDTIQSYKKLQYELNLKLKQQSEYQQQLQQLHLLLENRLKEIEEWKIRCSRFQQEAIRGKQLIHYNNQLSQKLQLASKEMERVNNVARQKIDEIQKWKAKLQEKEMENTKLKNIQTEIPQLQSKISMLKAQNERINSILKSRLSQIQTHKKRTTQLQSTIAKFAILQKDKQSIEDRFNKQIKNHQQLKFAYSKLQNDLNTYKRYQARCRQVQNVNNGLTREVDRLNGAIKNGNVQLNDYRQRFKQLEYQIDQYKSIESQVKDYENKIILLTQEIQRLNQLIKNKNGDLDQLESEKVQLHSKINHYKNYEMKMNENQQFLQKVQNNLEISKRDTENWQNKFRSADARIRQLENQLFGANSEKDKLGSVLRAKMTELDDIKNRYNNLEGDMRQMSEIRQVCQEQHNQIVTYLSDIETFDRRAKQYEKELNRERTKNADLTKKTTALGTQLEKISKEFDRINRESTAKKAQEFEELQQHFSRLMTRSKSTETELQVLTTKCVQLQNQVRKLMQQFARLLKQAEKSQAQTRTLYQRLNEYQDYARRISILDAELNRLEIQNKKLQEDNKMMRLKYASGMQGEKRQEQFNLVTVLMAAEIQSLRERLDQRQLSFEEMRKSILDPVRRI